MKLRITLIAIIMVTFFIACSKKDDITNEVLEKPELISPGIGLYGDGLAQLEFDWTDVVGADKYKIIISNQTNNNVVIEEEVINSNFEINKSNFIDNYPYKWEVMAMSDDGENSKYSSRSFTYIFGDVQLISPLNNSSFQNGISSINLKCEDLSSIGITQYRFDIYRDGGFLVSQSNSLTNEYTLNNPLPNTIYTWSVSATKTTGGQLVSNTFSFQTE